MAFRSGDRVVVGGRAATFERPAGAGASVVRFADDGLVATVATHDLRPASERIGSAPGPAGVTYSLHFYGEAELAAVVLKPAVGQTDQREDMVEMEELVRFRDMPDLEAAVAAVAAWASEQGLKVDWTTAANRR